MKIFLFLLGIVAAGIVGYSFEPQMRQSLTGKTPETKRDRVSVQTRMVDAGVPKRAIDPSTWPVDQLPKKVQLKGDVEIANETGDIKMTITAGNRVDLVRLEGQTLIISPGPGPFSGSVPVIQTDLLDQLATLTKNPPAANPDPAPADPSAIAANTPEAPVPADPAGTPPAVPVEEVTPAPVDPEVAANDTPAADTPVEEPAEEPEAEPTPVASTGSTNVVEIMQASIKAGDIKEFTFDQVQEWTAGDAPETIDGESFQTGLASYKAETVFGVKTIQAKALVQDGKVVRWLWPKSGMEIK